MALRSSDPIQNPVDSIKQFVGKPGCRIQLDELFEQVADCLCNKLNGDEFSPETDFDQQKFKTRVEAYEQKTEQLAKMAGVLGRWGDGSELSLVLNVIRVLYAHARTTSRHNPAWINLRSYPAVLIFTAYGIGLTHAERWGAFHELCSAEIAVDDQKFARLIETLFLWDWWAVPSDEPWQQEEHDKKRLTPLTDHLYDVLSNWRKSFVGLTADFEMLYERFEVMGSLAHLSSTPGSNLKSTLENSDNKNLVNWKRMPIGRTGWNGRTCEHLFKELQSRRKRESLAKAGFVESEQYIDLFRINFGRVAGKLHWRL